MSSPAKPAVAVVVPSAHAALRTVHYGGGGKKTTFSREYMLQHPEWLLEKEEEVDWSESRGTVLDASYKTLPTIAPLTAMPTFTHLTVLCLRESGVIDIELLELCNRLVHLDLSSNEVVHLVGGDFWASFPDLLVLLLHGNKVIVCFHE